MESRQAIDTIKGYFYQFDYSILKLLELDEVDSNITVEGIEDIDIKRAESEVAIQCKYHSKVEYNHSVIAKPIRLMLDDFQRREDKELNYYLVGHFNSGHDKLKSNFDIEFLKKTFLHTQKKVKKLNSTRN